MVPSTCVTMVKRLFVSRAGGRQFKVCSSSPSRASTSWPAISAHFFARWLAARRRPTGVEWPGYYLSPARRSRIWDLVSTALSPVFN